MSARYKIHLKNTSGTTVAIFDQYIRLTYKKQVNKPGYYSLWMWGNDERIDLFTLDSQIEVWRSVPDQNVDWYLDFEALHRTPVRQRIKSGPPMFTSYGRGYGDFLTRRHIMYAPGTTFTQKSAAGETVLKEFVNENAGPGANNVNRLANGVTSGLTIEADTANGTVWSGSRSYKNLQTVCQEIAEDSGVDYAVVGTGPATFEFRVFDGQLGTDRTIVGITADSGGLNGAGNAPVIFSVGHGNMEIPIYSLSRNDEINQLFMLGKGIRTERRIREVSNGDSADSPWNRREGTRQASSATNNAELDALGADYLTRLGQQESFVFDAVQVPSTIYGRDYFLGDLVTARFDSIERNKKIVDVEVNVAASQQLTESIKIELADLSFI